MADLLVFVTSGRDCNRIAFAKEQQPVVTSIEELVTVQEEADTRMLLHAAHASKNACQSVIVRSPDTDVAFLCLYFAGEILKPLYFETGVKDSHRVIDVKAMATALGPDICKALPGLHALTGCDSTSSFHGKGKVSCYSRLSSDAECLEILSCLGVTFTFPAELLSKIEKVVCAVYEFISTSVGEARYAMFCAKGGWEKNLPPSKAALLQHAMRANYQTAIWKASLQQDAEVPSPDGHGWSVEEDEIRITWSTEQAAPSNILALTSCKCKKARCESKRCSCVQFRLPCTDLCQCVGCENRAEVQCELNGDSNTDGE